MTFFRNIFQWSMKQDLDKKYQSLFKNVGYVFFPKCLKELFAFNIYTYIHIGFLRLEKFLDFSTQ